MASMTAITLTQPWATLVALGHKSVETRSWQTRHRGPLAIHAGKNLQPVGGKTGLALLCEQEPFATALKGVDLPFGAIVAVVDLIGCVPTTTLKARPEIVGELGGTVQPDELAFGDYSPRRYGWIFADVEATRPPWPEIRGKQGLWSVGVRDAR